MCVNVPVAHLTDSMHFFLHRFGVDFDFGIDLTGETSSIEYTEEKKKKKKKKPENCPYFFWLIQIFEWRSVSEWKFNLEKKKKKKNLVLLIAIHYFCPYRYQ